MICLMGCLRRRRMHSWKYQVSKITMNPLRIMTSHILSMCELLASKW
uniref:Uncharacterized protein n=1 Tax=Rhizophora mucronata TaxID=61149 RepID=A0A2P2R272_RHIMU